MDPLGWQYCPHCGTELGRRREDGRERAYCARCDRRFFADPPVAANVLVIDAGRVLLGRRVMEPGRGLWSLPGGFVDYGEKIRAAAAREVLEESGLEVVITTLLDVSDFVTPDESKRGIVVFFRAELGGGTLAPGSDIDRVGWFSPDELPPLAFEGDAAVIEAWHAGRAG